MRGFVATALAVSCVGLLVYGCLVPGIGPKTEWEVEKVYSVFTSSTLTIAATQTSDTTEVFMGYPNMVITLIPYGTANYDSFHGGGSDSVQVDVIVEGLSHKNGATANIIGRARVFDPWVAQTYGKIAQRDSTFRRVDTTLNDSTKSGYTLQQLFADYTAGTGSWDSLRIDLMNIANAMEKPFWPYCRVIVQDVVKKTGKNWAGKVVVYGYE